MSKKLSTLIPNTILSPFNRVLYDNILQPYVQEKQENIQTRNVSIDREDYSDIATDHIDANISQYQPIVNVDGVSYSFYDLISLMQRYGINVDDFDQWGQCDANSLNLPINYDKFVNYNKYGWIGDKTPNYVVIRSSITQINEALIQTARLTNDEPTILAAMSTLLSELFSTDPLGGFDTSGFDTYNFDGASTSISTLSDWEVNNKWVHVDDILPGTSYQLGTFPIIEYSNKIKLVEWIKLIHSWSYRPSINSNWETTTNVPTLLELQAGQREHVTIQTYEYIVPSSKRIYFNDTTDYSSGDLFVIDGSSNRWTVDTVSVDYVTILEDNFSYFRFNDSKKLIKLSDYDVVDVTLTEVVVKGDVTSFIGAITPSSKITIIDFFTNSPQQFKLMSASFSLGFTYLVFDNSLGANVPTIELNGRFTNVALSSNGDIWSGLVGHWCYNGIVDAIAYPNQTIQAKTNITTTYAPDTQISIIEIGSYQPNSTQQIKLKINGFDYTHFVFGVYESLVFTEATNQYQLINAIKLDSDITTSVITTVVVEIGNDSVEDSGYNNFLVRVSQTDSTLRPVCLNFYKQYIQTQNKYNIYPLFECYTTSNTPILQPNGINILRFKENGDNVIFSTEINRFIAISSDGVALLETDLVDENGTHFQANTIYGYKHIWSNNNNRIVSIEQVDENGHPSVSSGVWKAPDYLLGNINNSISNVIDVDTLTQHFQMVNAFNPNYRTIDEDLIQNNQPNRIVCYNTAFSGVINQLTNTSLFANILDAHKQIRLFYMSIFFKEIINTISVSVVDSISLWFDAVLTQIRTYDQLKSINHNEFLHPLTVAMLFTDKKTLPHIVGQNILTHDNQLISYDEVFDYVKQSIINSPLYGITPQALDDFIYLTVDTIFVYDGLTSTWNEYSVVEVVLNLWKMLEDGLYNISTSTINSVGVLNSDNIKKSLKQKYIQFSNMKGFTFPYSNRSVYKLSNPFTWMYNDIDLVNVVSPLPLIPTLTSSYWGASWKEIYNKIYGTHAPHLEPWKLQGYASKPTWWDTEYDDPTNTRQWLSVMWTNILDGIVPVGLSLPTVGVGTGLPGQVAQYVFVPVNIYSTATSDGFAPDDILPPFRSLPSSPTATDLLVQDCVLINNISFVDLSKTNSVLDDFGNGTLQEWEWKQQIDYRYDELYSLYNSDPTIMFKRSGIDTIDGVEFLSSKLINNETFQQNSVSQLLDMYETYSAYYNKDFSKFDWTNINHSFGILLGSYINKDNLMIDELARNSYDLVKKTDEFNTFQNISNFKITIQDVDNTKRNDLMGGYVFLVDSFNRELHEVEVLTAMYTDMQVVSQYTALIDLNVYDCLSTGSKVTITWDFFTPPEFEEQNDFYIIKRGGNTISLCRSVKELNTTNFINLPTDYPYGMHLGVVAEEFNVLNKQITAQTFKSYAVAYGSSEVVTLPVILTGIQQLVNFFDGYIKCLRKNGITEHNQMFPVNDENFNRPLNYQFAKEMMIAGLYNDKNTRNSFVGNVYTMLPFNNNIYVDSTKQVLSLVQSLERQDLTLLYDRDGVSIPTSHLIVFRHVPISIQTNILIGGGTIYLSTSQDIIVLNSTICNMAIRKYPSSLNIISGTLKDLNGFINLDDVFEYSFAESVNNLSNAYSNKPNSEVFTNNAYQQVGFVNDEWYTNVGMSKTSAFQFWKEMLPSKGSIECIEPFSKIGNQQFAINEIFAVNRHTIGFKDDFDFVEANLQNIKAVLQNGDNTVNALTLPNDVKQFTNTVIDQNLYTSNVSYVSVGLYDEYELLVELDIDQPFYNEVLPRFSGAMYSKTFYQSYHESNITVVVNGNIVEFGILPLINGYTIQLNVDPDIINDINIVTKTDVRLSSYYYDSISTIKFDENDLHVFTLAQYSLIGKNRTQINVGWSSNTKNNIDTLEYFDPVKNSIPGVDYFGEDDPFSAYDLDYGVINNVTNSNNINQVGDVWYKKSLIYYPFYNSTLSSNQRIDNYGKTVLQDDGYYQFVKSINMPQSWYDFTQTDSTVEINGEPLSYIMKRTRLTINDSWSGWVVVDPIHERLSAVYTPTITVLPTIGSIGDVIYVYVNGNLSDVVVKGAVPINITIPNTFEKYVVDFVIRPTLLSDTLLVEYKREFNYYTNIIDGDQYYYFWVKNYRDTNFTNAYNLNERHYKSLNGMYGLLDGNLCVFNLNYSLQNGKIAVVNNDSPHSIWSYHTTNEDTQKIPKDLWTKMVNCFDSTIPTTTVYELNGVMCSKDDLVYTINSVIVDNYDKITPYIPAELIVHNNSSYLTVIELYFILPPQLVNIIVKTILLSRSYDVSSLIMQTSQVELVSNQEIS